MAESIVFDNNVYLDARGIYNQGATLQELQWMKAFITQQMDTSQTINFSGTVVTREPAFFLVVCGQGGISPIITVAFRGNGNVAEASTSDLYISDSLSGVITAGQGSITVGPYGSNWGKILILLLQPNLTIAS